MIYKSKQWWSREWHSISRIQKSSSYFISIEDLIWIEQLRKKMSDNSIHLRKRVTSIWPEKQIIRRWFSAKALSQSKNLAQNKMINTLARKGSTMFLSRSCRLAMELCKLSSTIYHARHQLTSSIINPWILST